MCSTVNMLCCVFANQIVDLPSPTPFFIHSLRIIDIREKGKSKNRLGDMPTCRCLFKEPKLEDVEIASINTSIGDIQCEKQLDCIAEKYGFEADMANLDSPGLSQTQIIPDYDDLKGDLGGDEETLEEEEEETEEETDEEEGESTDDDGEGGGKKRKKGKKGKKGKKIKKEKGEKDKKDKKEKDKKEKDKKEKDKKEKDKKEKDKKEKDKKEKGEKDKKEKDKKDKGKEDKKKKGKGDDKGPDEGTDEDADKDKDEDGDKGKDEDGDKDKDKDKDKDREKKGDAGEEECRLSQMSECSVQPTVCGSEDSVCELETKPPPGCLPNSYPGYSCIPHNLAVVGSETGSYESLCNLIRTGFKCADRILTMTPWGNYVVFKSQASYLLYDGCTCNVNRFRHLDLTVGTAGLLCFTDLHELIEHIMRGKGSKTDKDISCERKYLERVIDEICEQYCN